MSPDPIKVLGPTQHLGECLAACVNQTDCFSYTYHFDSKTCDLACMPTEYATVDNCLSYLVKYVVFLSDFCGVMVNPPGLDERERQ